MSKIIDTHCHYNLEPIFSDYEKYLSEAQNAGVTHAICVGTSLETSIRSVEIAQKHENLFATCGIHPNYCQKLVEQHPSITEVQTADILNKINSELFKLNQLIKKNIDKKIVAIGEIGLDFYRLKKKGLKRDIIEEVQIYLFERQLKLAFKYNLPIILHVRDQLDREKNAYYQTLDIVKKYSNEISKTHFVLHCVSGPEDYVTECIRLGAYIGIAGNITYSSAKDLRKLIALAPIEKLLLETDAPYLIPQESPHEFCHPKDISITAEYLLKNLQLNLDIIRSNTFKVFTKLTEE